MSKDFSPLQNHILHKLKNADYLKYSDLVPDNTPKVPNDLFNYHLQQLVKKGYVTRLTSGYSLSVIGVKHVADENPIQMGGVFDAKTALSLFKVNVLIVVSRMIDGKVQILNQVRKSHPSYGKVGVMGGVVRKFEPMAEAAKRKLEAETGLVATLENLKLVAMERRFLYADGEQFSDVFFPIYYTDVFSGKLKDKTDFGENMWVDIDQAILNESSLYDSIVSLKKVLIEIERGNISSMQYFYHESKQDGPLDVLVG